MTYSEILGNKVLNGEKITKEEALKLYEQPLDELCQKADEIRKKLFYFRSQCCHIR